MRIDALPREQIFLARERVTRASLVMVLVLGFQMVAKYGLIR